MVNPQMIKIGFIVYCCCYCCLLLFMRFGNSPNWLRDTLSITNLGSHRKIKMHPSDCEEGDIFVKFKNKASNCIRFYVKSEDDTIYKKQSANNACVNTEFHVCVPKGGYISVTRTTGGAATKTSNSRLHYDDIKKYHVDKVKSRSILEELWDKVLGNKNDNDIIEIKHSTKWQFARYYLGDKNPNPWHGNCNTKLHSTGMGTLRGERTNC
jgi:hypothetical protein